MINELNNLQLDDNYRMISLDIVSLYPSIPQNLVIECIYQKWNQIYNYTDISLDDFINLIKLCFECSFFKFNNNFYKQINGTPMGSSLSSTISELVQVIRENFFAILYYKWYVDETFMIINKNSISQLYRVFRILGMCFSAKN